MTAQNRVRLDEIDGIRGWAAFVVLLFHVIGEMLKYAVPAVNNAWFAPLLAGDIAVLVFFVLSGDALSSAFFAGGGNKVIDRLLVRRYLRLTIPIVMSCAITYLIMVLGFDFHIQAAKVLQRPDWLAQFLQFKASIVGLLRYSLLGVYVSHTRELSYSPFLWTMSIEMIGSMLVFLLCYLWKTLKNPHWICLVLIIWLTALGSYFSLFYAGVLLGYCRQQGYFEKLLDNKSHQIAVPCILIAIAGMLILTKGLHRPIILTLPISMLLVFCFYTQKQIKLFFSNKLSRFLGDISFPLYLIHFQVLISLMSWLVVKNFADKDLVDQNVMLKIAVITLLFSLFAAWCFRCLERAILKQADSFTLRILK